MSNTKMLLVLIILLISQLTFAQKLIKPRLKNATDSVYYCLGLDVAKNFKNQGLIPFNFNIFSYAMKAYYNDSKLLISQDSVPIIIQKYFEDLYINQSNKNKEAGKKFLDENKLKPDVITLNSGLQYTVLIDGTGANPILTDNVTINIIGTTVDGINIDNSNKKNKPLTLIVDAGIPAWTEALLLMKEGSKWKLFVPSYLAYGERSPNAIIGPNASLIYEIELISINKSK